ncbi:MAG: hypothetical protein QXG10_04320 [Candidatus Hadarchaeales archaeon]
MRIIFKQGYCKKGRLTAMKRILPAFIISFLILALASGAALASVENAGVTPENGPWTYEFTFYMSYRGESGIDIKPEYPLLYLDSVGIPMSENDPFDNDASDGKIYVLTWRPGAENVGPHSFYFVAVLENDDVIRFPSEGEIEGPDVLRVKPLFICSVSKSEAMPGEKVTISGTVVTADENLPISGSDLEVYQMVYENEILAGSTRTGPDGEFSMEVQPQEQGIYCYRVRITDNLHYEEPVSKRLYVSTIDKVTLLLGYSGALAVIAVILCVLITSGLGRKNAIAISVLGAIIGFLLMYLGAGELGVLAAGAISGYIWSKNSREWSKHVRMGIATGIIIVFIVGTLLAYLLTLPPDLIGFVFSVTQGEMTSYLIQWAISSIFMFLALAALGAIIGGLIRKLLNPQVKEVQR